jgi:hypothetical protein
MLKGSIKLLHLSVDAIILRFCQDMLDFPLFFYFFGFFSVIFLIVFFILFLILGFPLFILRTFGVISFKNGLLKGVPKSLKYYFDKEKSK